MKRTLGMLAVTGLMLLLAGCGSSNTSQNTTQNSQTIAKVKHRVFVSNQFSTFGTASGRVDILDGDKDVIATNQPQLTTTGTFVASPLSIAVGGIPTFMLLTPDKKTTLLFDTQTATIDFLDNASETFIANLAMGDRTDSLVINSDNKNAFTALRNTGQVAMLDITVPKLVTNIAIPTARTVALSHNGKVLLVFADDDNTVYSIDTTKIDTATTTSTTKPTAITAASLDHPVLGIFNADDSKAYILNCGAECGGTTASVSVLDVATNKITASVAVSAATTGLLDSSGNLYVAGTQGKAGKLDVVSTANLTVAKSGIAISDGVHTKMVLASNNRLFIAARTCNNVTTGCLTMYNTSAGSAVISTPKGDVTGIQAISGRNIVYVAEGGEIRIYDTTKDAEINSFTSGTPIDIVGKAYDITAIDQ